MKYLTLSNIFGWTTENQEDLERMLELANTVGLSTKQIFSNMFEYYTPTEESFVDWISNIMYEIQWHIWYTPLDTFSDQFTKDEQYELEIALDSITSKFYCEVDEDKRLYKFSDVIDELDFTSEEWKKEILVAIIEKTDHELKLNQKEFLCQ